MWAWSCWPFVMDLVLVRDCKMVPHCKEVSGRLRVKPFCGKWVVVMVVYKDWLRKIGL
jgi:hypothetical protein